MRLNSGMPGGKFWVRSTLLLALMLWLAVANPPVRAQPKMPPGFGKQPDAKGAPDPGSSGAGISFKSVAGKGRSGTPINWKLWGGVGGGVIVFILLLAVAL